MHRLAAPLLLVIVASGCAPSGDDPLNRHTAWVSPAGEYTVRYLAPPWELVRELDTGVFLRIQSNAMSIGGIETGPGKYELTSTIEAGTPSGRVAAERAAMMGAGREIVVEPRELVTDEGVAAMELVAFSNTAIWDFYRRVVYYPLGAGRVVRVEIAATPNLDTAEVTAMLRLVSVAGGP